MSEPIISEEWRPVVGWEGWYSVSDYGRVRRDRPGGCTFVGKILGIGINRGGYAYVVLSRNSKSHIVTVHKLVGQAFIGIRPKGMCANHKDGNKANNHIGNLEWVTPSQNTRHSIDVLGRWANNKGSRHGNSKLTEADVLEIRRRHATGQETMTVIAKSFHVSLGHVSEIVGRKNWTHI